MQTEHAEQVELIQWYRRTYGNSLLVAIPNGGVRHAAVGARLKLEGVSKGFPDLFLPIPTPTHHGLFIELKRREGGRLSKEQKEWLDYLTGAGYEARVCAGAGEAIIVITNYLQSVTNR